MGNHDSSQPSDSSDLQRRQIAEEILDEAEQSLMRLLIESHPKPHSNTNPDPDAAAPPDRAADSTIDDPNSPRHRKPDLDVETCPLTGRPMIEGEYIERRCGMERRSGQDRRAGDERRVNVELIYHNQRFGPNRRSGLDRRSGQDRRQNP